MPQNFINRQAIILWDIENEMKIAENISKISNYLFNKYEWLISLLLKLDFTHVNKRKYIKHIVEKYYGKHNNEYLKIAYKKSLASILTPQQQKAVYRKLIWKYGLIVFLVSFILTFVPENLTYTIISCILDLAIFQCFLFIAMQKILLLYGNDCDLENAETKSIETIISIDSSGLMIGKYPFLQKMKSVMGWLSKQLVKKVGPNFVTKASKSVFLVVRRQMIKWFSIVIAKEHVDFVFNALIPFTCAFISGLVSAIIFIPMCNKLRKHLVDNIQNSNASANAVPL